MQPTSVSRRSFLTGAAGFAAATAALAACGGGSPGESGGATTTAAGSTSSPGAPSGSPAGSTPPTASNQAAAGPPALVPFSGVSPDLPGSADGLPAGFYHYPDDPPSIINHPLGKGGDISFLLQANPAWAPLSKNRWWQALNAAVNANLQVSSVAGADYATKFPTVIAGGDLPDVMQMEHVPNMVDVLEAKFTDLTEHIGGDNVKKYPSLASIPTQSWEAVTINGRIWGIPQARPPVGQCVNTRGDVMKGLGITDNSPKVANGQEFVDLCKQLSDPKRGKYAIGQLPTNNALNFVLEMMEAPNGWREEGGKFTSVLETDEMKDALSQVAAMWKAEVFHPDSFATPDQLWTWWSGGITSLYLQDAAKWIADFTTWAEPGWDMGVIVGPKWGGGGIAKKALQPAYYGGFAVLKKAKAERITELLNVCDYFAAPFGTKEFLTMNYGAKGADYTLNGSDPVPTEAATSDYPQGLQYVGSQVFFPLYAGGDEAPVKTVHDYMSTVLNNGTISDASWGLYSPTALSAAKSAGANISNTQADIVAGRKGVSAWDGVVKSWQQDAGNAMRKEYEEAFAAAHGG